MLALCANLHPGSIALGLPITSQPAGGAHSALASIASNPTLPALLGIALVVTLVSLAIKHRRA